MFEPGISVVGLGSGGGENQQPEVVLQGEHTVSAVAGTLALEGLTLQSAAGVALTFGGARGGDAMPGRR